MYYKNSILYIFYMLHNIWIYLGNILHIGMPFYIYIQCKCVLSYRHIYIYIYIYTPYIYIFHKCWWFYKNSTGWIRAFFRTKAMWPNCKFERRSYFVGHSTSSLSSPISPDDQRNGRLCLKIKLTNSDWERSELGNGWPDVISQNQAKSSV